MKHTYQVQRYDAASDKIRGRIIPDDDPVASNISELAGKLDACAAQVYQAWKDRE
jgi:hypothetical protein